MNEENGLKTSWTQSNLVFPSKKSSRVLLHLNEITTFKMRFHLSGAKGQFLFFFTHGLKSKAKILISWSFAILFHLLSLWDGSFHGDVRRRPFICGSSAIVTRFISFMFWWLQYALSSRYLYWNYNMSLCVIFFFFSRVFYFEIATVKALLLPGGLLGLERPHRGTTNDRFHSILLVCFKVFLNSQDDFSKRYESMKVMVFRKCNL